MPSELIRSAGAAHTRRRRRRGRGQLRGRYRREGTHEHGRHTSIPLQNELEGFCAHLLQQQVVVPLDTVDTHDAVPRPDRLMRRTGGVPLRQEPVVGDLLDQESPFVGVVHGQTHGAPTPPPEAHHHGQLRCLDVQQLLILQLIPHIQQVLAGVSQATDPAAARGRIKSSVYDDLQSQRALHAGVPPDTLEFLHCYEGPQLQGGHHRTVQFWILPKKRLRQHPVLASHLPSFGLLAGDTGPL
mmetsp:Transcript_100249/g.321489  ORF Transcript_100249/g.321489 Transcript_100249/m.321489 type:complete len:242 (-) Transcript_100249:766-1491(-)